MWRSSSTGHHQQRDNFINKAFNNKWLQSAGLHHLHSSNVPPLQEFGFHGNVVGGQSSRPGKNPQRSISGDNCEDPNTPPACSRSSSLRKNGGLEEVSPSELSPGLLDLHSFDTELIPEVPSKYHGFSFDQPVGGRSLDDTDPYILHSKRTNGGSGVADNYLIKSFSSDKETVANVAKIKVVVRKRPLNKKENAKKEEDIIMIDSNTNSLTVHETKQKVDLTEFVERHEFVFDAVLDEDVSNDEVYAETVEPIVPLIFQRTKATCFAYGQTGSGKTYTMQPLPLKAAQDMFMLIHHTYRNQGFQLCVSFYEIYRGKVFDLLNNRKKLVMREDGKQQVCIVGLQEYRVFDVEAVKELIEKGNATRSTGITGANEESSRSHAILQLAVKRIIDGNESKPARIIGKLSFIDLAGSERGADTTDNDKQTRMEGAEINKSLLALKECIRALDNDLGHIPFRGSKLTEVLRDSFVGDSRTVMISCISPSSGSCEHTLNTLRYADRVKSLSKGNNSKRETPSSSSSNLFNSIAKPLSSILSSASASVDSSVDIYQETSKTSWTMQSESGASASRSVERVPSGRPQLNVAASPRVNNNSNSNNNKGNNQFDLSEHNFDYSEEKLEERPSWKLSKNRDSYKTLTLEDKIRKMGIQIRQSDMPDLETNNTNANDDLNALLKEEEDLVNAHRKLVEETMDVVREEMHLLVEVDHPGNQLDDYVSRLQMILSQKAAGIVQLQTHLAQFQSHLKDYNVLVTADQ